MPHAAHGHAAQRGPRSAQQAYRPHGAGKARVKGRDDCKVSNSKGPFTFSRFFNIVHAVQPPSAPQGVPAFLERAPVVRFLGCVHAPYTHLLLIILAAAGPGPKSSDPLGNSRRFGALSPAATAPWRWRESRVAAGAPGRQIDCAVLPPTSRATPEPFPHWREDAHGAIPLARRLVERAGALFK